MTMKLSPALLFAASVVVGACASEPQPRPARIDPANPTAAESPPLTVGALAATPAPSEATPAKTGAKDQPATGTDEKTTYTCPMHPEVVSDKPGRCPKCGMNLVPKAEAPPQGKK